MHCPPNLQDSVIKSYEMKCRFVKEQKLKLKRSYSIYLNVTFASHPEPIKDESSEIQKSEEPYFSIWQVSMAFRVGLGPRWRPVNAHIPSVSRSLGFHWQYFWNGVPLGPWITHLNAVTTWCVVHRAHQSSIETSREACICSLYANTTNHFIFLNYDMGVFGNRLMSFNEHDCLCV